MVWRLKTLAPNIRLVLLLTPCPYRTGHEVEYAKSLGIETILKPKETINALFFKKFPQKKGAILALGGDPWYARVWGLRYQIPAYLYTEDPNVSSLLFEHVFYKNKDGDLMADYVQMAKERKIDLKQQEYCLWLCGSRPQHAEPILNLFTEAILIIQKKRPQFKPVLPCSPFLNDTVKQKLKKIQNSSITVVPQQAIYLMPDAKLMVSLPGTNTAEAAYMGLPTLMVLPLNQPELLIFHGILGMISKIPILGRLFKKILIHHLSKTPPLLALPNKMEKKEIIPEVVKKISAEELAEQVLSLYENKEKLQIIKNDLHLFAKHFKKETSLPDRMIHIILSEKNL